MNVEPVPFRITGVLPLYCTVADRNQLHLISDSELEALTEMKRDHIIEIFWGSLGAFLGAIIPAIESLSRLNAEANPMSGWGVAQVGIAVAAGAITLLTGILWWQRGSKKTQLVQQIRARQSVSMNT